MILQFQSVGSRTDTGLARPNNEDAFGQLVPSTPGGISGMLVVSDGMGGYEAGEVASRMVVESWWDHAAAWNQSLGPADPLDLMIGQAVEELHQAVRERGRVEAKSGMGATLVSAILWQNRWYLANVGDSPCYLMRNGQLSILYESDNEIDRLLNAGKITREDAQASAFKNHLSQAIGFEGEVKAHVQSLDAVPGDRLLLCSDGLTRHVALPEIQDVLQLEANDQASADQLVEMAVRRGGRDNVTVMVVTLSGRPNSRIKHTTRAFGRREIGILAVSAVTLVAGLTLIAKSLLPVDQTGAKPASQPTPSASASLMPTALPQPEKSPQLTLSAMRSGQLMSLKVDLSTWLASPPVIEVNSKPYTGDLVPLSPQKRYQLPLEATLTQFPNGIELTINQTLEIYVDRKLVGRSKPGIPFTVSSQARRIGFYLAGKDLPVVIDGLSPVAP